MQAVSDSVTLERAPRLTGSLRNVASLRIDAGATCLRAKSFSYDISTDGPTRIALSDGRIVVLRGAGEHRGRIRSAGH